MKFKLPSKGGKNRVPEPFPAWVSGMAVEKKDPLKEVLEALDANTGMKLNDDVKREIGSFVNVEDYKPKVTPRATIKESFDNRWASMKKKAVDTVLSYVDDCLKKPRGCHVADPLEGHDPVKVIDLPMRRTVGEIFSFFSFWNDLLIDAVVEESSFNAMLLYMDVLKGVYQELIYCGYDPKSMKYTYSSGHKDLSGTWCPIVWDPSGNDDENQFQFSNSKSQRADSITESFRLWIDLR